MVRFWNNIKTVFLMGGLMGLLLAAGSTWGQHGLLIALVLGGTMNLIAFFFSDRIAIAAMRGREVDARTGGDLYAMVDRLRQRAGLPMPRVYICPQEAPNAFATGRSPSHAAVAVTQGALRLLDHEEMEGVMAHELAHIKNRDTLISTIAATIAGVLAYLAQMAMFFGVPRGRDAGPNALIALLGVVVAWLGAVLIQMAISRSREFVADADGASIAGSPRGLASALRKLETVGKRIPMDNPNPAQNNLFIVEPFCGNAVLRLFATHPPTGDRIAALLGRA
ncbi:MAG: zinc metalloprotease HtpX [Phycisphaeraceae bacterium]|nr:MAG: zinc metalloprotease HtpX [Phycisphaeraceae bacterium]